MASPTFSKASLRSAPPARVHHRALSVPTLPALRGTLVTVASKSGTGAWQRGVLTCMQLHVGRVVKVCSQLAGGGGLRREQSGVHCCRGGQLQAAAAAAHSKFNPGTAADRYSRSFSWLLAGVASSSGGWLAASAWLSCWAGAAAASLDCCTAVVSSRRRLVLGCRWGRASPSSKLHDASNASAPLPDILGLQSNK